MLGFRYHVESLAVSQFCQQFSPLECHAAVGLELSILKCNLMLKISILVTVWVVLSESHASFVTVGPCPVVDCIIYPGIARLIMLMGQSVLLMDHRAHLLVIWSPNPRIYDANEMGA